MKTESDNQPIRKTFLDDFLDGIKAGYYDYIDSYEYVITDKNNKIGISDLAKVFDESGPQWFEYLFVLRNKIVSLFGLKTSASPIGNNDNNGSEPGVKAGIFKVFGKTETEMVLGEDDKHLDVRIVLLLKRSRQNEEEKEITVATVVKLHNRLGRCYFFFIKPFHQTVIPFILKRKFRQLETEIG